MVGWDSATADPAPPHTHSPHTHSPLTTMTLQHFMPRRPNHLGIARTKIEEGCDLLAGRVEFHWWAWKSAVTSMRRCC